MGKRTSKKSSSFLSRSSRTPKRTLIRPHPPHALISDRRDRVGDAASSFGCKKKGNCRMWMRFFKDGHSEVLQCHKNAILNCVCVLPSDLRILGPVFSRSSNILTRDKAIIINLEFIKAIVTAEEVLILDPLCQEVLPFVDKLKRALCKSQVRIDDHNSHVDQEMHPSVGQAFAHCEIVECEQSELPFEFQVLEMAMEVVCTFLDSSVADLERDAYPLLDELVKNVNRKNLELVRNLKGKVTHLFARVQKVKNEIEHLLDDDNDMAQFYLTRKHHLNQQNETMAPAGTSNSILPIVGSDIHQSESIISNKCNSDVEDLEMLLEAFFVSLDGTRNKILRYIDDAEDYVNIQLDNHRNELIQLQVILSIAMFSIAVATMLAGAFSMNIPCPLYDVSHLFAGFVCGISMASFLLGSIFLGYAKWNKLLG